MSKFRMIRDYISYRWNAKTKHGIHSPFVFEFATKVLVKRSLNDENVKKIESIRKKLLRSKEIINVIDLGALEGASIHKKKKVRDIAHLSAKSKKYAQIFYRMIRLYQPKKILELGTSLGISSMYMSAAAPDSNIITVEGCPQISGIAEKNVKDMGFTNIKLLIGDFDLILQEILEAENKFDLIFFDGNHREDATIRYFELCLPYINNDTIFIFDDINWSEGMKNAWNYICEHPSVKVSLDLFFMGIVFFRKESSKEHFVLRFS